MFVLNHFWTGRVFLFPSVDLKMIFRPFWSLSFEFFKEKSRTQLYGHIKWHDLLPSENSREVKGEEEIFYIYIKERA